jgi:hypothetical protein
MIVTNKDTDLNGECADGKGSLNGAEAAQGAIPTGAFDFNALRLSQAYEQTAGVEKLPCVKGLYE